MEEKSDVWADLDALYSVDLNSAGFVQDANPIGDGDFDSVAILEEFSTSPGGEFFPMFGESTPPMETEFEAGEEAGVQEVTRDGESRQEATRGGSIGEEEMAGHDHSAARPDASEEPSVEEEADAISFIAVRIL